MPMWPLHLNAQWAVPAQPCGEAGSPVTACRCRAGGRPEAARRAGLESVEKLLPMNLTSTDTTERNAGMLASRSSRRWSTWRLALAPRGPGRRRRCIGQARRSSSALTWTDGWYQLRVSVGWKYSGCSPRLDLGSPHQPGMAHAQGGHDGPVLAMPTPPPSLAAPAQTPKAAGTANAEVAEGNGPRRHCTWCFHPHRPLGGLATRDAPAVALCPGRRWRS